MHIDELLKIMVERRASDLHLKVGSPPIIRVDGTLINLNFDKFSPESLQDLMFEILSERQKEKFLEEHELDLSYSVAGLARFRINMSMQRGTVRAVLRQVPIKIPTLEELNLPADILKKLAHQPQGIILLTGPTGTGKSTTLAAMVEYINLTRNCHIVTIEDPIEFLYRDKKSIISQREVGFDTESFVSAMKRVLRQDPDVILIGEMRDLETIQTAVTAAETGHLVLSTLHVGEAAQAVDRIIDAFPPHQQSQIRIQLATTLQGIVTQRLLPCADGKGRLPAVEILIATPLVRKMILEKEPPKRLYEVMQGSGKYHGMRTLNQSLCELIKAGKVNKEDAFAISPNPDELSLLLRGVYTVPSIIEEKEEIPDEEKFKRQLPIEF